MTRIIIEIKGGLVQAVWSTDGSIEADVLDRDLPENGEDYDECIQDIARLEVAIGRLRMVDIY